jgi:hypothetical protein
MAVLTEEERRELKELAASLALREDLQTLARRRARHFVRNGQVDVDLAVAFLTEINEMINHQPKPFKAIIDGDMRL